MKLNEPTFKRTDNVQDKIIRKNSIKDLCAVQQNCKNKKQRKNHVIEVSKEFDIEHKKAHDDKHLLIPLTNLKIMWRPSIFSKSSDILKRSISLGKNSCCTHMRTHAQKKRLVIVGDTSNQHDYVMLLFSSSLFPFFFESCVPYVFCET